jgi:1-deoxy-D-xylulose-5-phosphate reductoisomerase
MMEIPLIPKSILHFDKSSGHLKKRIAIIGSTGSIGIQALEVIRQNQDKFTAEVLTAFSNDDLLIKQAIEFTPNAVVIGNENCYQKVADALSGFPVKVFAGETSVSQIVEMDTIDLVLNALVGYSGLRPTLSAIDSGKDIALANKESLVVAGDLVMKKASEKRVSIIPVDSEHSAIFQCLAGEFLNSVEKVWLTASGGPFRGIKRQQLMSVTKEAALNHPKWKMGNKITIDSASLMNKGYEVIEAKWLFSLQPEQIEVIIHPQSIIHSLVQFIDGSMKAQLGVPDMKLPVLYAFGYPFRILSDFPRFSFTDCSELTFEQPDLANFRNLGFAYHALHKGGNMPCVLNAANEVAVSAFLNDRVSFLQMSDVIEHCMEKISHKSAPVYEDYVNTHIETQCKAQEFINRI